MAQNPLEVSEQLRRYRRYKITQDALTGAAPYLRLNSVIIYVRDQDQSLRFYVDDLGFRLVVDARFEGGRWVAVSPSDDSAVLALLPESAAEGNPINRRTGVTFATEDIAAKFRDWSSRGIRFNKAPMPVPWGIHATFEDLDGNQFDLIQSPWLNEILVVERQAAQERREAERRAAQELEIARQVQARLFPRKMPSLETLVCAGVCRQARQVGGDYYDFLELGSGHLAVVVGDVAGKGIAAALLMANLQACVRTQYALALDSLPRLLASVNRVLYDNTGDGSYATLFFAEYKRDCNCLHYMNCGHYPGLLLHPDGLLERLEPTNTVVGLFEKWDHRSAEIAFGPGDTLVLYTDGVTEAMSDDGSEFGEERLIELLRAHAHLPVPELLQQILKGVDDFSGDEQHDDITVVIARCVPA